jgi:hypothetical protein
MAEGARGERCPAVRPPLGEAEIARRAFYQGPPVAQPHPPPWREFARRQDGMAYAMDGGLWLHRHVWRGTPMAHLVSTDRAALLEYGAAVGLGEHRLQFKPLRDPRTGERRDAWHWDLVDRFLPP